MKLTFDDGPGADTTRLLEVLAEGGVKASFFMVGNRVKTLPDVAAKVAAGGHTVGNHSVTHPHLPDLDLNNVRTELSGCSRIIKEATGVMPVRWRAPYGSSTPAIAHVAEQLGMMYQERWDVDPRDWEGPPSADTIFGRVVDGVEVSRESDPVVLLHDGPQLRSNTVKAVERLLAEGLVAG